MALPAGERLGPYEIVSKIGAGGMGEVYRARDKRLERDVAIKILPENFAAQSDRLRRFESEARCSSALNHPNIVTIYEIGSTDSLHFIAMEYVQGKSLRQVLNEGPMSFKKMIQIAAQLADGLAKAHNAGIIHRDLKPENILINNDGFCKIVDFGLAKLVPQMGGEISELQTTAKTEPGRILGTVGYMSPEQAICTEVDYRSDQFSLGVILYEMVSAKRAF